MLINPKHIIRLSVLLIAIFMNSCDSPTDVQANRIKIENKIDGSQIFEISPKGFMLDNLILDREYETIFLIKNLSNKSQRFSKLKFKYQPENFRLLSNEPIVLSPAGQEGSQKYVSVIVKPKLLGNLSDSLFIDSYFQPALPYSAIVPTIYTSDVDFGESRIGETKYKTIDIYNFGDKLAIIRGVKLIGDSTVYNIENFNPITAPLILNPGAVAKQLIISFKPTKDISYQAKYEFQVETSNEGFIDGTTNVSGFGR